MRKLSLCLICLFLIVGLAAQAENLIYNADFSYLREDGTPYGWSTDAYYGNRSDFSCVTEDGAVCLAISNYDYNDARWTQVVDVEPDTQYVFRARVKAADCSLTRDTADGELSCRGVNISILSNSSAYSASLYDTHGEWVDLELYGITGSNQDSLTLALRVGGYSGDTSGTAFFTDVVFEECEAPSGIFPVSFATLAPSKASSTTITTSAPERITETLVLMGFLFLLAGLALMRKGRALAAQEDLSSARRSHILLALLAFVALIVRLYMAVRVRGYSVDINDFMIWGENFARDGLSFYETTGLHDYPPLYMMLLGLMSLVRRLFGIEFLSTAHVVLVKLIPIFCDLLLGGLVYALFRRRAGGKRALLLASAIFFNPAFIADSAAWGQVDSVMTILLALSVYLAMEGNWRLSLPCFALSLFIKPQAALFGPVGLAALVADAITQRRDRKRLRGMLHGLLLSVAVVFVLSAPFAYHACFVYGGGNFLSTLFAPFTWAWNLFAEATSTYRYLSVNACNLYVLLDKNWASMDYYTALSRFAWICFALSYVAGILLSLFSRKRGALPLAGAVLISLIFAFAPMMHERYLFPALAILALAYIEHRDWRILVSFLTVTLTQYLNIALVLEGGTVAEYASYGHLQNAEFFINGLVSALNIANALWITYTAVDILFFRHVRCLSAAELPRKTLKKPCRPGQRRFTRGKKASLTASLRLSDWRLHLRRADYLLMAGLTAVYSVVAFVNLGSTKAPQTFWQSTEYHEQVVFDLGEERTFRLTYFGGISDSTFTIALSNDGEHWTEDNNAGYGAGEIFRWIWYTPKTWSSAQSAYTTAYRDESRVVDTGEGGAVFSYPSVNSTFPLQTARYVRLTSEGLGLILNEFGFWDVDSETLYPVSSVTGSVPDADYSVLIDEQDTVAFTPSYFNSTYFDEIYHARTAYELAHGMTVFEWSHPHLGKLIIMLGIQLFGMTPFGWRCMGALVGVIMLPVMYLLIKQLTKKTKLAFLGAFLLSVDSMHFTQTRIATIDSYPVLFIMLMYLFMFRYFQMNAHREKLWRTFIPLGLSGFFMGCACASKWIGIYAAAGLCVIFFLSVFLRFKEYLALRGQAQADEETRRAVKRYPRNLLLTLLFCLLMFIIVPLLIYYFSYYLHYAPTGGLTIEKVWNMQKQMFNYHSGLGGDTHYFRSPWYEWPLIIKPMWYYSSDIAYTGRGFVSSISCMGNPAVWWTGLVALIVMLIVLCVRARTQWTALLIAIGFASQFLPWVLVPRSTFIYHYFASIPFLILAIVWLLDLLAQRAPAVTEFLSITLACAALALFIMFYPLESGAICTYRYALKLRWFNWYNFQLQ